MVTACKMFVLQEENATLPAGITHYDESQLRDLKVQKCTLNPEQVVLIG